MAPKPKPARFAILMIMADRDLAHQASLSPIYRPQLLLLY
jgi:hypothetical protein